MTKNAVVCLLAVLAVASAPKVAFTAVLPVSSGLILNFQADNIDGTNNATLLDGQEVTSWADLAVGGDNAIANHLTVQGAADYSVAGQGTPNYVAGVIPGVLFTRTGGNAGDALGFDTAIDGLGTEFTAFFVGNINADNGGPARIAQFGRRNGANHRIVGLANTGYRFNGASKTFAENQVIDGPHLATYTMDMTQLYSAAGYRVDGAAGTSPATSGDQVLNATSFNQGIVVGGGKNSSATFIDPLNGVVHALLVYNRLLSIAEIEQVEAHLSQRYLVPEPSTAALASLGAALAFFVRRRKLAVA